jgi:glycosyltransferase involved in cell wall biosynthesis
MISELLTIVIPTRNRPDFLELCLRSVFERQQVVPRVFVSDNSTSDVPATHSLRERFPFTYIRQSGNLSMTEHHNACLNLPETPWALLLHDDDELYPQALSKLEPFLERCANAGVVVGGFQTIDEHSVVKAEWTPKRSDTLRGEEGVLQLGLNYLAHPPGTVINVAAFRQAGGFPDALGASADFPLILHLTSAYGLAYFPDFIGRYRVGSHQTTDFSPKGAERTMDQTIRMSNLCRTIGVSQTVADQLIDYNTWWIFRIIAARLFAAHPFFVLKLFRKCLHETPTIGKWKDQIRQEWPVFFFPQTWLSVLAYTVALRLVPSSIRRRMGRRARSSMTSTALF